MINKLEVILLIVSITAHVGFGVTDCANGIQPQILPIADTLDVVRFPIIPAAGFSDGVREPLIPVESVGCCWQM